MTQDKALYVQKKWRQVVIPLAFATSLAVIYIVISLVAWTLGNSAWIADDLFKFCLLVAGFSIPFYGFLWLIRSIVLAGVSKPRR